MTNDFASMILMTYSLSVYGLGMCNTFTRLCKAFMMVVFPFPHPPARTIPNLLFSCVKKADSRLTWAFSSSVATNSLRRNSTSTLIADIKLTKASSSLSGRLKRGIVPFLCRKADINASALILVVLFSNSITSIFLFKSS